MVVLLALNNLAFTYEDWLKYDKAIKTYKESLKFRRQCDDGNLVEMSASAYMEITFVIVHVGIFVIISQYFLFSSHESRLLL